MKVLRLALGLFFITSFAFAEWQSPERNFNRVQHEKLRKNIDSKYNILHDELSDCYYNYWKKGLSKPFQQYDKGNTLEESKQIFDKLHGLIFQQRMVKFHEENLKQTLEDRIPEAEYNYFYDKKGTITGKKNEVSQQKIDALEILGFSITDTTPIVR